MAQYFHAHHVDTSKCKGHRSCMRRCPTQAIRVRNGKAIISDELCVDCGNCIEACPEGAVVATSDILNGISRFQYKVMVPSPVLYAQFEPRIHPYVIHMALKRIGFDEVVDVTISSIALSRALELYLRDYKGRLPLISSYCPCIVRLIQVKYPDLVELIVPLEVPREITAREIRKGFPQKLNIPAEEIGLFYMATCPAKVVSVKQPAEKNKSWFDGVVSVKDVYSILVHLVPVINKEFDERMVPDDFAFNSEWVTTGSLTRFANKENWLNVSGLENVVKILDDIENSRLRNISFIEVTAHMLGCVGGPYNVENPYLARANSIRQDEKYEKHIPTNDIEVERQLKEGHFSMEFPILPRPTRYFDTDLETSIKRMKERERVFQKLPQIDCGCCGSPTCLAFAEDFVRGSVTLIDCYHFLSSSTNEKP
ncbi:MAG: [Fe-Fe] hydrogenase large subunit C-terminal domain-containing protein [bacterium]